MNPAPDVLSVRGRVASTPADPAPCEGGAITAETAPPPATANPWRRFWDHGTWWKALIAVVGYLVVYEAFSALVVGPLWGHLVDPNIFATPASVLVGLVVPILFGAVVLIAFLASLGWIRSLFGRQPVAGRAWMWAIVVLVLIPVVLRVVGTDYSRFDPSVVALTFAAGLLIGFTEEVLTRGIAVKILRSAGHGELVVAVVSSALFGLLHAVNILSGQSLFTVGLTVLFAFGFGMLMYLVLRVTGNLVWPILLHAITDPTSFLSTGGIDVVPAEQSPLVALAGPFNMVFVVVAIVALFLIRGRADQTTQA